jgi:GxxExxY protein
MQNEALTELIIGCAFKVHNTLGSGFLEKVYENALRIELTKHGLSVKQQQPITVYYEGEAVGDFFADLIINGCIILELKATEKILPIHEVQLVTYLNGTGFDIGLLLNFGASVTIKKKYRIYKGK